MTREYKLYRLMYTVMYALLWLLSFPKYIGRENIPDGACVVVSNHTSNLDCFYMIGAMKRKNHTRLLAKAELYKIPLVGGFLRKTGMIRVDRGVADMAPIRDSLAHLKNGGKIGIFPEGRRVQGEEAAEAKLGAIRIAERTGAPVLPMYIPRKKRLFRKNTVYIGKPYTVTQDKKRLTAEESARLAEDMMERIRALGDTKR